MAELETFDTVVGLLVFAAALAGGIVWLALGATRTGLLLPVAVGAALRLVIMASAHWGSVEAGESGFMFRDDRAFADSGMALAADWLAGHIVDPSAFQYAGSVAFGYETLLGVVFLVVGPSVFAGKLVNVLLSSATIWVSGLLGERLLGERAKVRAAWVVALAPTLIWWSAPLLKESLAMLLVVSALLAATKLPAPGASAGLLACVGMLFIVRAPAAAAVVAGVAVSYAVAVLQQRHAICWRGLVRYLALVVLCLVGALVVVSKGNPAVLVEQYRSTIDSMIDLYEAGNPARLPADVMRTFIAPYPWVFDADTNNWGRALYPGMWVWYLVLPTAAVGFWRLRHRPEFWLLVVPVCILVVTNVITSGFTVRQRSSIEPLLLLAAVAGFEAWRPTLLRAAAGLGGIAVFAAAQTQSVIVTLAIAAASALTVLTARRMRVCPPDPVLSQSVIADSALRLAPPDLRLGVMSVLGRVRSAVTVAPSPAHGPRRLWRRTAGARLRSVAPFVAPLATAPIVDAPTHARARFARVSRRWTSAATFARLADGVRRVAALPSAVAPEIRPAGLAHGRLPSFGRGLSERSGHLSGGVVSVRAVAPFVDPATSPLPWARSGLARLRGEAPVPALGVAFPKARALQLGAPPVGAVTLRGGVGTRHVVRSLRAVAPVPGRRNRP